MLALTNEELLAVLRHARAKSERDWLMILLAFWHGLRASEVVGLTADNFHDRKITIQRLKGSNKTTHDLVEDPEPLLSERQAVLNRCLILLPNQRLFPITRVQFFRIFRRHATSAGVEKHKRHPHVLKHTIAMQSIDSAGVHNVRQYLGHKSGSSTMMYLALDDATATAAVQTAARRR